MWLPCNFGESIRIREHMGRELIECTLIGITNGIFNGGMTYLFQKASSTSFSKYAIKHTDSKSFESASKYQSERLVFMDLKNEISFWPNAFNNTDSYDPNSLNDGEIELEINIEQVVKYNRYFLDTKSSASGRCICISRLSDGKYRYTFQGSDGLAKYFIVPELFIRKPFISYDEELLS